MVQKPIVKNERAVTAPEKGKTCFVIAPIGPEGSEIRKQSDQVLKHIIKKALEPRYIVERADDINRSGTIIAQVVQRVFEADLVVADLSRRNANVFYELAIRHATRKPAVHLAVAEEDVPFDVNQIRLIKFNLTDPDSIEDAQRRLGEQVEAIEAGEQVTTPVQFAQIMHSLESGDTRDQQLLELLRGLAQGIESVQVQVSNIGIVLSGLPLVRPQGFPNVVTLGGYANRIYTPGIWEQPNVQFETFRFPSSRAKATEPKVTPQVGQPEPVVEAVEVGDSAAPVGDSEEEGGE